MIKATTLGCRLTAVSLLLACAMAAAQSVAPTPIEPKSSEKTRPASALAPLSWLEGCWRGNVNNHEFREHWLPLRGDLLVGISHTVSEGKTLGYEYLRIENRADGAYYVAAPPGAAEAAPPPHAPACERNHQVEQAPHRREHPVRRIEAGLGERRVPGGDAPRGNPAAERRDRKAQQDETGQAEQVAARAGGRGCGRSSCINHV